MILGALPELNEGRDRPQEDPMRRRRLGALPIIGIAVSLIAAPATYADVTPQAVACTVNYGASNWGGGGGFTANLHVTNLGDPIAGWTLAFTYPGNQRVTLPG